MPLLKDQDRQALQQTFAEMPGRVRLIFFTQALDCETCEITGKILEEIAPLGEKIELVKYNFAIDKDKVSYYNIARIPAIAILRLEESPIASGEPELREHDYGIRFYGVPAGYEFMSLIGSILDVSVGDSQLTPLSRELVAHVKEPTHIQVFTTPT